MPKQVLSTGAVCHMTIPAPDIEKAREFYSTVFQWKMLGAMPGGNYLLFDNGQMSGGFSSDMEASEDGIHIALKVDDIPAKLKEIVRAGGQVTHEKTEIGGGHGFYANFKDPNGNSLSIWSDK